MASMIKHFFRKTSDRRGAESLKIEYDSSADVLHISFPFAREGDCTYCHNFQDVVMVLRDIETDVPVGVEILDVKRHGPEKSREYLKAALRSEIDAMQRKKRELEERVAELQRDLRHDLELENLVFA